MQTNYPFTPGGVADYPVKVGSMLLTLVDPERGYERAYNRWYERDHFYAGCLIGPYLFAGARWVATRALKDLRWPRESAIAQPFDAGSYMATYWVLEGHHEEHFDAWARPQVRELYAEGRGFAKRTHVHTALFDHLGATYRDADPVPIELALDRGYDPPRSSRASSGRSSCRSCSRSRTWRSHQRGCRARARTSPRTCRCISAPAPAAPSACASCSS